ncbi:MAG: serine/threonine-protein kinase, partial [Polyangiaceae bacterium]
SLSDLDRTAVSPAFVADEVLKPGDIVDGRFTVERALGRGGMGVVYLARDINLERWTALKMLPKTMASSAEMLSAFRREAAAIAAIRNEYVVQVHSFGAHRATVYFAMEYVRGADLSTIIHEHAARKSTVPKLRALTILSLVGRGLGVVHRAGVVHRDVKPSNIVIEEGTGRPVLIDFGLVMQADTELGALISGTPAYLAPELWNPEGVRATPRSDVYSLGCTAFQLFTGVPPFQAPDVESYMALHTEAPIPKLSLRAPALAPFDGVITRALQKDPAARFADGKAFAEALERIDTGDAFDASVLPTVTASPSIEGATRILVVDDDPVFRRIAGRAAQLAFAGASVVIDTASSGNEALQKAANQAPELVLLDFTMPGLDGIATLSRLRALPSAARARVIVISGTVGDIERWQFSVLGVREFFAKLDGLNALVELIAKVADEMGLRE